MRNPPLALRILPASRVPGRDVKGSAIGQIRGGGAAGYPRPGGSRHPRKAGVAPPVLPLPTIAAAMRRVLLTLVVLLAAAPAAHAQSSCLGQLSAQDVPQKPGPALRFGITPGVQTG